MNVSDFTLTIVPPANLVFVLVAAVLFYVKREEIANERKIKYIAAYLKERMKQKSKIETEIAELDKLRANKEIDDITYERLKYLLKANEAAGHEN